MTRRNNNDHEAYYVWIVLGATAVAAAWTYLTGAVVLPWGVTCLAALVGLSAVRALAERGQEGRRR